MYEQVFVAQLIYFSFKQTKTLVRNLSDNDILNNRKDKFHKKR